MKNFIISILAITLFSLSAISQNDTLNRYDTNNNKTGWWKVYLDKYLAETKDMSQAKYYKFSYFEGKFDYFNMGSIGSDKNPVIAPVSNESTEEIPALDGEYKANYSNGQTKYIYVADNGKLTEYREYYENGTLKTRFDYTKSCGDEPFHFCIYLYNKDGSLKTETTIKPPKK